MLVRGVGEGNDDKNCNLIILSVDLTIGRVIYFFIVFNGVIYSASTLMMIIIMIIIKKKNVLMDF